MKLRFFADQCVPGSIIRALREEGREILQLRDSIAIDAPDPVVLHKAQELDAILLSLNGDFADIVSYPPSEYKGIIALQVRNHPEPYSPLPFIKTVFSVQRSAIRGGILE